MGLAKDYLYTEGALLTVLMEMKRHRVFAELNYSGIFDYCERALRLSRAQAYYFKTVAEKSEVVPELKMAIDQGELTLSAARRIAPVVTAENQRHWIEKAKNLSQANLERAVTEANPKAHVKEDIKPVAKELSQLRVPVDNKTHENLSALKEILSQKRGRAASLADVIAWMAEETRERFDPERKARRKITNISSGNASPPPKVDKYGRSPIPAHIKHQVVLNQGWQCMYVGMDGRRCSQKRWLDLHHVIEVSKGGPNTPENLKILCKSHHAFIHNGHSSRLGDSGAKK